MASVTNPATFVTTLNGTPVNTGGAASNLAAITDNLDATYVALFSGGVAAQERIRIGFADFTLPTGAVMTSIYFNIKCRGANGGAVRLMYAASTLAPTDNNQISGISVPNNQITTVTLGEFIGTAKTLATINDYVVLAGDFGINYATDIIEASATLTYNEMPTVSNVGPTGNKFNNQPTVTWEYFDPESVAQAKYRVKVFSNAQYSAGGFAPETSTATWDSTEVSSPALLRQVGVALADNTYRAYVKSNDGGVWSTWAFTTFTVITSLPNQATLTAPVVNNTTKSVALSFAAHDNLLTLNQSSLETDTTGWLASSNCTITRTTAQAANGSASLQITVGASGGLDAVVVTAARISVIPGQTYTARAQFRSAATARSCALKAVWYGADNVGNGYAAPDNTTVTTTTTGWTEVVWTFTVPAGKIQVNLYPTIIAPAASEVHYVDKLSFALGTAAETPWNIGGYPAVSYMEVLRSTDAGATWTVVRGANGVSTFLLSTQTGSITDYEMPLGKSVIYKARVIGYLDINEPSFGTYSANTSFVTVTTSSDWWIKDTGTPANNMVLGVLDRHDQTIKGQESVYYPLGRKYPVVVSDVTNGEDGTIDYDVQTLAEWTALKKILSSTNVLLLQSPYNSDQWYIRIVNDRQVTMHNTATTAPYRTGSIAYVEVDAGVV